MAAGEEGSLKWEEESRRAGEQESKLPKQGCWDVSATWRMISDNCRMRIDSTTGL